MDERDLSDLGRAVAESRRRSLAAQLDELMHADPAVAIRLGVAGNDPAAQRARLAIATELLAEVTRRSDDAYRRATTQTEPYVPQPFGLVAVRNNGGDLIAAMTDPSYIDSEMIDYLGLDTYHRITEDGESWIHPLDQASNRGLLADAIAALQGGHLVEPISSGEAYDEAGTYQRPAPLPGIVEAIAAHEAREQRRVADLADNPHDPRSLPEPVPDNAARPREPSTRLRELLDSIAENLDEARRIMNDQTVGDDPERSARDAAGRDRGQQAVSNLVRSDMTAAEQVRADARREQPGPEQFRADEIEVLARVDPAEADHARLNWQHRRPERAAGQPGVDWHLER